MVKKDDFKLAIYQLDNGQIEVNFDKNEETVWLTQKQMGEIFDVSIATVNEHLQNIFKSEELDKNSVIRKFLITASDGKKYNTIHYNLDAIISVGYRVNSKVATKFRKWATSVLKEHITSGFTINKNRISQNYDNFLKAVEDLKKLTIGANISNDEILNLVQTFADTWLNLDNFDKGNLPEKGFTKTDLKLNSSMLYDDIELFKKDLIGKGLATELFAQEKNEGNLEGIFGNVFASFGGVDLYETIEEKAANFLYFVVKNHPFNDGNKRTGAFCFVWFLQKYKFDFKPIISPETLTTLTLLIANSDPKEKERMIGLVLIILKK